MEHINLRALEIFVAVVDCGSFTAAAERLYLAQSTVSGNIQSLEESLGTPLLRRESRRRLTLTADGRRVYHAAQDILARCSALRSDVSGALDQELRLAASTVPAQAILPRCLAVFGREHPDCRCDLHCTDSAEVHRLLLDGKAQLGFVGSTDDRQELFYEPIAEDHLVLVAPNTPRFASLHERGAYGRELFGEPFLFREHGSGTQKLIDNYLSSIRLDPQLIHTAAYVSDSVVLQRLVAEGMGVSILSALAVQEYADAGRLLCFELDEQPLRRGIYMAWRRKGSMSALARSFADLVREQCKSAAV